jgi:hypothetical protein
VTDPAAFTAALDTSEPVGPHFTVDGEGPTDDVVQTVLAALAVPPA